jgi:hypothetical protein
LPGYASSTPRGDGEGAGVVLGVVGLEEVAHRLAGRDPERLARRSADRDHDRAVRLRRRAAAELRVADEDHGALRRVDLLAGDREDGVAGEDEVQLLVAVGSRACLVVLGHRGRPGGDRANGVDAECSDAELRAEPDALALLAPVRQSGLRDREDREAGVGGGGHDVPSHAVEWRLGRSPSRDVILRRSAPRRQGRPTAAARRRSARSTERSLCRSGSGWNIEASLRGAIS